MLAFKIFLGVLGAGFMGAIAWCCSLLDKHKNRLEEIERRMELYEHLQDNYYAKTEKSSLRVSSLADAVDVLTNRLNMLYDHVGKQRDATALSVDDLIASRNSLASICDALYDMLNGQQRSIDYLHTVNDMFAKEQLALEEKVEQTELDIQEEFRANDNAFHNRLMRVEEKLGMVQWVDLEDGEDVEMEPEEGEKQGTDVDFEAENVPENPE